MMDNPVTTCPPRWLAFARRALTPVCLLAALAACQQMPPVNVDAEKIDAPTAKTARAEQETASFPISPPMPAGPVRAERYMVVAAHPLATKAGFEILQAGGSAVDAAIATKIVLGLVEPQSSGIGGGGFMLHYGAGKGEITAYDGRETAPAAATPGMFLDSDGQPRPRRDVAIGGLPVGVPGLLRMLEMAHQEHGRLPWARLFEPAIRIAEKGFSISPWLHKLTQEGKLGDSYPGGGGPVAAYFLDENGNAKPVGSLLTNKAMARTLKAIAKAGADAFYEGPIAEAVVATVRNAPRNPALMTLEDLRTYKAVKRNPVCLPYRTWTVCGMPPPTSGGVSTLQILGILQSFDLGDLAPDSAEAAHLIAEAGRLAFADRNTYLADPDFVPAPVQGLLDPGYLKLRAGEISTRRSMGQAFPGMPGVGGVFRWSPASQDEGHSTSHLSIIDGQGNAVSMTTSVNQRFGSQLMTRGFLLNNVLINFDFVPERDGGPVANQAAPRKRPRSSMAPTLVLDDSKSRVTMVVGTPGGPRIIGFVAQALIAALDWKMDPQAIAAMGHVLNRNGFTELEEKTPAADLAQALTKLGHKVKIGPLTSGLHIIIRRNGVLLGGADPRREGKAMGK